MAIVIKLDDSHMAQIPQRVVDEIRAEGMPFILELHEGGLLIAPAGRVAREGWDEAFDKARQGYGDDEWFPEEAALDYDADMSDWDW